MSTELLHQTNLTISSREIAQITEKQHKHVLTDCDKLNAEYIKMSMAEISADLYKDTYQREQREYKLNRMQTFDLMTGYDLELITAITRKSCNYDYQVVTQKAVQKKYFNNNTQLP